MSPRPYRLGQRKAAIDQTRDRIVTAALELLRESGRLSEFSIDAVARRADVVRMTVYYQFGSKRELLEAVFDTLAMRALVPRLRRSFQQREPLDALRELIAAFGGFWASDRLVMRRLRSLAALDPDFEQGVRARDERRREHLRGIVRRLIETHGRPLAATEAETVNVLHTLTSFETFDTLAGPDRDPEAITPLVQRLAGAVLGLSEEHAGPEETAAMKKAAHLNRPERPKGRKK
jgi:AcrR family transcriptional regulator